eukprot:8153123-Pyramimonas_sp.AAC.1
MKAPLISRNLRRSYRVQRTWYIIGNLNLRTLKAAYDWQDKTNEGNGGSSTPPCLYDPVELQSPLGEGYRMVPTQWIEIDKNERLRRPGGPSVAPQYK